MYIYICIYKNICIHLHIYMFIYMYMYIYVYIYVRGGKADVDSERGRQTAATAPKARACVSV